MLDRGYKMAFDTIMTPYFTPATVYARNTDISSFGTDQTIPDCPRTSASSPGNTVTGAIPPIITAGDTLPNQSQAGLSRGAIGGIIGGIVALFVIIGAATTWMVLRRRKAHAPAPPAVTPGGYHNERYPHEMHGASAKMYETHGDGMTELAQPGIGYAHELLSQNNPVKAEVAADNVVAYELPGGMPVSTSHTPTVSKGAT